MPTDPNDTGDAARAATSPRHDSDREARHAVRRDGRTPGLRRWALVQVWNRAVLATFADEASAREAMSTADDDELVVLSGG
jgi:hypothetical protein